MRLCGISSRFQLLSPCTRQVTHALLTRPPLSHKIISPEGNQIKCFVRLACVKHAASVHPEPGSNSHVKVVWFLHQSNWLIRCISSIHCREQSSRVQISDLRCLQFLKVLFSEQSYRFISETFSIEFSGLHYCLFVKVLSACLICDSFNRLSCLSFFVKHFFK